MADDDKKRADDDDARRRADAEAGQKLDKILTGLDSISSYCDSLGKRMDAMEGKMRADDDARKRKDAEEDEKAKADAAKKDDDDAKKDADQPGDEPGKKGEVAADKRKDDDDAKKDADKTKGEHEDDEGEHENAKGDSRKDSANASTISQIKQWVETRFARPSDEMRASLAKIQERAEPHFQAFGDSCPAPMAGELPGDYDLRILNKLKGHSAVYKDSDLAKIGDTAAFDAARTHIFNDADRAAAAPQGLAPGQLREIKRADGTGRVISTFVGNGSFVRAFKQPTRAIKRVVTNFRDR